VSLGIISFLEYIYGSVYMAESGEAKPSNRVRVAIATIDGATIASGHFAHSTHFMIIDLEGGKANPVEIRENPSGDMFPIPIWNLRRSMARVSLSTRCSIDT